MFIDRLEVHDDLIRVGAILWPNDTPAELVQTAVQAFVAAALRQYAIAHRDSPEVLAMLGPANA